MPHPQPTPYTYEQLKEKTVVELREIAAAVKHEAVQGYTQMNKEHLLAAFCKAFNLDMHIHHHVKAGVNKQEIKLQIRQLKARRDEALEGHDLSQLKVLRHEMHELRRSLRKAIAVAGKE